MGTDFTLSLLFKAQKSFICTHLLHHLELWMMGEGVRDFIAMDMWYISLRRNYGVHVSQLDIRGGIDFCRIRRDNEEAKITKNSSRLML